MNPRKERLFYKNSVGDIIEVFTAGDIPKNVICVFARGPSDAERTFRRAKGKIAETIVWKNTNILSYSKERN